MCGAITSFKGIGKDVTLEFVDLCRCGEYRLSEPPVTKTAPTTNSALRARLKRAMPEPWRNWLDNDVRWIITHQEFVDFRTLTTDEQRDDFVRKFWERRNPHPGSAVNIFREEYSRRLAFADSHFGTAQKQVAGSRTHQGRVYISYGPPDKIEHCLRSEHTDEKKGPDHFDWEVWHYPFIEGLGKDVTIEFVDTCACGEYHLTRDPFDKLDPEITK